MLFVLLGVVMAKPKKMAFVDGKRVLVDYDVVNRKESDHAYNKKRSIEKTEYLDLYHSTEWRHIRREVLDRDLGLCVRCGLQGNIVDHIIPSEDDWGNRFNIDNLETLCKKCHNKKTKREWLKRNKGGRRDMAIHVVAGYPGSGRHDYVRSKLTKNDLVYDYEMLLNDLSGNNLVEKNLASKSNQLNIHEYIALIYEMILRKLKSEQTFNNVWLILTYPDERLFDLLSPIDDVDYIRLDVKRKQCELNLADVQNFDDYIKQMNIIDQLNNEGKFERFKSIKLKSKTEN